jgi:DNA-binding winged helix-turn-helix (wHTH) protein
LRARTDAIINRLRETPGDSAETPHFVETVLRRGYGLIAPVERLVTGADRVMLIENFR